MNYRDLSFSVDERVVDLGVTGVYFAMGDLENREYDPTFDDLCREVVDQFLDRDSADRDPTSDPVLAGFRDLHTAVGRSNRQNVASPENLLRIIQRSGRLPRVNLLVDIYNLVSVRTRLALGAHDIARVSGNIRLALTDGTERFVPLGSAEAKPVHAGEYGYIDDAGDVICRMEVRQVEKTKVELTTTECFYIVQGNSATNAEYVWAAAHELITLTKEYCRGNERILYGP
jgi:DNA/RNA-binding domain of Phe-tRNA-synthetase-like protein